MAHRSPRERACETPTHDERFGEATDLTCVAVAKSYTSATQPPCGREDSAPLEPRQRSLRSSSAHSDSLGYLENGRQAAVERTRTPAPVPDAGPPAAPRRGPGHRGADMRDTVAEMAERAQLISQEAGTKVAAAMKDVISAAAGIAGFAIESARDLVQYMVKRGQMTPEEADKLIRDVEAAHDKRPASEKGRPTATKIAAERAAVAKAEAAARSAAAMPPYRPPAPSDDAAARAAESSRRLRP